MAFFGIDSRYADPNDGLLSLSDAEPHCHGLSHQLRSGDVVFLKQFAPHRGLDVLAVGSVTRDEVTDAAGNHAPVSWLWRGCRHTVEPEDLSPFRAEPVYEEFDLAVQRELIDLLPLSRDNPFAMVLSGVAES